MPLPGSSVRVHGLRELEQALAQLPKATGRAVLRRVGIRALKPVIERAKTLVPVDEGDLRDSLAVSTKLSTRQRRANARAVAKGKAAVQLYAGATALPHAHLVEFGSSKMSPRPFLRPAWDAERQGVLDSIKNELGGEIERTAQRRSKRIARQKALSGE